MWKNETDRKAVFENGILPCFVYGNRQEYNTLKRPRPMHSHDSLCELLLCYSGSGLYHVKDEEYSVCEGDVIMSNAREMHEVVSTEETEIGTYCFGFSELHFKGLPLNHMVPDGASYIRHSGNKYPLFRDLAEEILDNEQGTALERTNVQFLAISLLMMAYAIPIEQKSLIITDKTSHIVSKVKDYIGAHFTESIALSDIAENLSFSPTYISHVFKKMTGYSPIDYVIRCRIGYSQTLLISSELSVQHIATKVGYDNIAHFQTLFKKVVGITPFQYRANYLKSLRGERSQM
ncbi:MAG: helix-turn-helix transcriptional regulator [Lachnospiraceae bacterium]|nr:helix-turn-helix transcriptional regulator [Lachnospiraceae bacterium]